MGHPFILPSRSATLLAKATLVALANFRDEPIVRLVGLKTTREVHQVHLFSLEETVKRLCGYTVLESQYDPAYCEGTASSPSAVLFEFEGIRLEWSFRLFPRSIVPPFLWHSSIVW